MKYFLYTFLIIFAVVGFAVIYFLEERALQYGAPPYDSVNDDNPIFSVDPNDFSNWKRPDGPIRIGLQVGHWKRLEMPDELAAIRDRGGGTSGGGLAEWEVALKIAEETKSILKDQGYEVDILPATVPEKYWADAFVSIHADGNVNPLVSGYKVAPSRRDRTGLADDLSNYIEKSYRIESKLVPDPNITRNMTGYYAFNYRRYKHSIHPMTPGVLVETGFLTNPSDAKLLINNPQISARGIALGIIEFINNSDLIK